MASTLREEGGEEEEDNLICIYHTIESCYQVQLALSFFGSLTYFGGNYSIPNDCSHNAAIT